jgi:hypothetical protein
MDKEIEIINAILVDSSKPLTTSEISKLIFEKYEIKISKTIVKNYLWSYFRQLIKYNPNDYSYELISDKFLLEDVDIVIDKKTSRSISAMIDGDKIKVRIDGKLSLPTLVKSLAILNFRIGSNKRNTDLIKQINRILELLN